MILTGHFGRETFLSAILNLVENSFNNIFSMKEPGCTQVPGCKLSKTSPRRLQNVTKKNSLILTLYLKLSTKEKRYRNDMKTS